MEKSRHKHSSNLLDYGFPSFEEDHNTWNDIRERIKDNKRYVPDDNLRGYL